MTKLRWGILGTGQIAATFAKHLIKSQEGRPIAVGSRATHTALKFAHHHSIPHSHGSYAELLRDPDVEVVYIALPNHLHAEWAIRAFEAGKHVLVEKPFTVTHAEAAAVFDCARQQDRFVMEGFMYRCHPQTARLVELIREGAIGEVKMMQAVFSEDLPFDPHSRLFDRRMGGGAILDIGCYAVSLVRLIAGAATGLPFADPAELRGFGHIGATGVDEYACAILCFPSGILANLSVGIRLQQTNGLQIFGTQGMIHVPEPWIICVHGGSSKIHLRRYDPTTEETIEIACEDWLFSLEANTVATHLKQRTADSPAMSWEDTLGNMRTLDQWRIEAGLWSES